MLDFAMKVCTTLDDADFDGALKVNGLDDEDAWDIAAITAFRPGQTAWSAFQRHAAEQ
jgi:hypothetical protein